MMTRPEIIEAENCLARCLEQLQDDLGLQPNELALASTLMLAALLTYADSRRTALYAADKTATTMRLLLWALPAEAFGPDSDAKKAALSSINITD